MEEDLDFSLESFVEKIELPHRAKVTEGYYEPGDEDGDREFSYGEILHVRRIICPFVDLTFKHPDTGLMDSRITISTRNQDVRFRVITEMEALTLTKPRTFNNVKEIIEKWPNSIKSLADQFVEVPGSVPYAIVRGDELRLIRVISYADCADVRLELKSSSTKQLIQLPIGFTGSFSELDDPKSYSLQELVDVARVERYLRIDLLEKSTHQVRGLPKDFEGVLRMRRPQVLVEIARVLVRETDDEEYTGQPLLCPIDCDIKLTPRDASYMPMPAESHTLSSLGKDHADRRLPFIARIVGWTEETSILQNQMTKPGDHLVVYSRTSVDKILAHCDRKYFLIPVNHKGCFKRVTNGKTELTKEVTLGSLEAETFPFGVEYFNTSEYRNTTDDQLPLNEELTFDRFVKADSCVVVSKLFGDAIGAGFHLPLRTKITIRMERRWKRSTTAPQHMSHLDNCSEQITEGLYHELMRTSEYGKIRKKERLPPVTPPRPVQPNAALANRPQPPLPPTANHRPVIRTRNKNKDDGDSSDDDYSYIDIESLDPTRPESATEEEIKKGIIEIPVNGNISAFNTYQMVFFLRENHAPMKTLSTWRRQRFDGMDFARMSDDDLKTHGIANPVVQFFRDRSKMQLVLAQL